MTRTQIAKALRTTGEQAAIAVDAIAEVEQLAVQAGEQAEQANDDATSAEVVMTANAIGGPANKRDIARYAALTVEQQSAAQTLATSLYDGSRTVARCWVEALAQIEGDAANAQQAIDDAAAAKAKAGPTLRERADVALPEGQAAPEGYELVKVTGSFLQFARSTATEGPAWLTQCIAHSTTTGADNRKAGRNLGSSSARVAWCKGCKADAAKAAKAAAK